MNLLIIDLDRIYGVVSFPKKFDKSGVFVRKYSPAGFPIQVAQCMDLRVLSYILRNV